MDPNALRSALAAALDALDAPDPTPVPDDSPDITDIIEAEGEADAKRIEAEGEADAKRIEAAADAEVEVIEAEAEADVERIEAAADAEVEVIEAEVDAEQELADVPEDDESAPCVGEDCNTLTDGLGLDGVLDAATEVLDAPLDDAPVVEPDVPPAATHWYTKRRTFGRRK